MFNEVYWVNGERRNDLSFPVTAFSGAVSVNWFQTAPINWKYTLTNTMFHLTQEARKTPGSPSKGDIIKMLDPCRRNISIPLRYQIVSSVFPENI